MTILIVENDKSIADTLHIYLRETNNLVLKCDKVKDAITIIKGIKIDVILLDLLLDGEQSIPVIEFCSDTPDPPKIIIMSAWKQCHEIAKRYNLTNCLDKPFDLEALEKMIYAPK